MRLRSTIALLAAALTVGLVAWAFSRVVQGIVETSYEDQRHRLDLLAQPVPAVILGMGPPAIADRADLAARLWRLGHVAAFVTSGGQGPDEAEPEATTLRKALESQGVPAAAITEEAASRDTWENLVNISRLLGAAAQNGPVIVVTHDYHGRRAAEIATALGLDAIVVTTDGPRLDRRAYRLTRETASYLKWRLHRLLLALD